MKHGLAGGNLPPGLFDAGAAWWAIIVLALSLNTALKRLVLGGEWVTKRLKAIRYAIMQLTGGCGRQRSDEHPPRSVKSEAWDSGLGLTLVGGVLFVVEGRDSCQSETKSSAKAEHGWDHES